jgi:hypothetical protein
MQSLLRLDHIAYTSLRVLEEVPAQPPAPGTARDFSPRHWQKFRVRGALNFLEKCLEASRSPNELKATLSVTRALECIEAAINQSDVAIDYSALHFLRSILEDKDSIRQLTYEDWDIVWNSLAVLVRGFNEVSRALPMSAAASASSVASDGDDRYVHGLYKTLEELVRIFQEFCVTDEYIGSLSRCVTFQMTLSKSIPDPCDAFILDHYEKFNLCMPTHANWLNECEVIAEDFIRDDNKPRTTRLRAIAILTKVLPLVSQDDDTANDDFFTRIVIPLLKMLRKGRTADICRELVRLAIDIADSEREVWAIEICKILSICAAELPSTSRTSQDKHKVSHWRDSETTSSSEFTEDDSAADINLEATKGLVELFEKSLAKDTPAVSQKLFKDLVRLVQGPMIDSKARMEALDVLLRLRADSLYSVYMAEPLLRRNGRIPVVGMSCMYALTKIFQRKLQLRRDRGLHRPLPKLPLRTASMSKPTFPKIDFDLSMIMSPKTKTTIDQMRKS